MQCAFCGSKNLALKSVRYTDQRGDNIMLVEGVPCMECEHCGEQYFEAAVLEKIEADYAAISGKRKQPHHEIRVPVEKYANL